VQNVKKKKRRESSNGRVAKKNSCGKAQKLPEGRATKIRLLEGEAEPLQKETAKKNELEITPILMVVRKMAGDAGWGTTTKAACEQR